MFRSARWPLLLLALLLAPLLPAAPAHAAIGVPFDLGSNEVGGTGAASVTITTSAAAPAGASVIVVAGAFAGRHDMTGSATCSDSAGNLYATDVVRVVGGSEAAAICSTHGLAAALPAGSTITATFAAGGGSRSFFRVLARALAVSGLAAASALDRTADATGNGTTPSSGFAPATSQPDELLVGAVYDANNTTATNTLTPGDNGGVPATVCAQTGTSTWNAAFGVGNSSDAPVLHVLDCTVSRVGSFAARGAFANSSFTWITLLATYRAAAPTPTPTPTATATATGTPTPTATNTPTAIATSTSTATATGTPSYTATPTGTTRPTTTGTPLPPTATGSGTAIPPTPTGTPTPLAPTPTPVIPEPPALWLFGTGLLALGLWRSRRRGG